MEKQLEEILEKEIGVPVKIRCADFVPGEFYCRFACKGGMVYLRVTDQETRKGKRIIKML